MDTVDTNASHDLNAPEAPVVHDAHGNAVSPHTPGDIAAAPAEHGETGTETGPDKQVSSGPAGEQQQKVKDSVEKDEKIAKSDVDQELSGDGSGGATGGARSNQSVSVAKQKHHEDLVGVPHAEDDRPPYSAGDDNLYPTGRDAQGRDITPVTQKEIMAGTAVKLAGQPVLDAYGCIIGPENAIAHDNPQDIASSQKTASGNLSNAVMNARKAFNMPAVGKDAVTSDDQSINVKSYVGYLENIATASEAFLQQLDLQRVDLKSADASDLRQALQQPRLN